MKNIKIMIKKNIENIENKFKLIQKYENNNEQFKIKKKKYKKN